MGVMGRMGAMAGRPSGDFGATWTALAYAERLVFAVLAV